MLTSILIPMYNELRSIVHVVDQCVGLPLDKEVIVVDNASTDGSYEAVRDYIDGTGAAQVRLFRCSERGKARAVKCGIAHATGDVIVLHDADHEYDPRFIPLIAQQLAYYDVVHGARITRPYVLGLGQFMANKLLIALICRRYRTQLTDIFTGQRGYRRALLQSLDITATGFAIETELTLRVLAAGCRIAEVEVTYQPRTKAEGKKIGFADLLGILWKFETLSAAVDSKAGGSRRRPAVTHIAPERRTLNSLATMPCSDRTFTHCD